MPRYGNGVWTAWVEKGKDGATGTPGTPGADGLTPYVHFGLRQLGRRPYGLQHHRLGRQALHRAVR